MEKPLGSRYRLGEQLGAGAMGRVFTVSDEGGARYAAKVLRDELAEDQNLVARFLQERSILVGLRHPNLVAVHDLVVEGDTVAIVMDLVSGGDLRRKLTAAGTLLPAEVARVGAGVAAALAAVHAAGVVHRDVKPENVLLDDSVPRLTDFGISRLAAETDLGRRSLMVGTPQYMAPELGSGQEATPASDLYSLGIVLYELCCGVTPFAGRSMLAVIRLHENALPGRPAGIPDQLWDVITWLTAKEPGDRPSSAQQVSAVLDALVLELINVPLALPISTPPAPVPRQAPGPGTETVLAPPHIVTPNHVGRGGPVPQRKRRRGRVAITVLAVLLVLGAIGWYAVRSPVTTSTAATSTSTTTTTTSGSPTTTTTVSQTTTVTKPATMPDFVGKTLTAAQDSLPTTVKVNTVDQVNATAADGTVIAQDPKAGDPLGDAITLTVARQAVVAYLDSLRVATGGWSESGRSATIAGTGYLHAVGENVDARTSPSSVEYNISKGFRRLTATAGIDDNSGDSTLKMQLEIFGDGRELFNKPIPFGAQVPVDIDISGVLRLKIQYEAVSGRSCCAANYLVLGTAELLGLPGEVPTTSATTG
jgi:serine/threonine-protein kinase